MRIKVAELTKHKDTTFHYDFLMPFADDAEAGIRGREKVRVAVDAVYRGLQRGILLEGRFEALTRTNCHRCLKEFDLQVSGDFREEVELLSEETCLAGQDTACLGEAIDLAVLAREHLLLSLPLKFLCREDCRGICSLCGRDLAEGACGCSREFPDPRLEKLKELLQD